MFIQVAQHAGNVWHHPDGTHFRTQLWRWQLWSVNSRRCWVISSIFLSTESWTICTIHIYTSLYYKHPFYPIQKTCEASWSTQPWKKRFSLAFSQSSHLFPCLPNATVPNATVIGVVGQSPTRRRRAAGECPGLGCLQLWRTATDSEGRTDHVRRALVRVGGWMDKRGILKGFKGIDPPFVFVGLCDMSLSGLWFGTMEFYDFPIQLGMSSSQLLLTPWFFRGVAKNHQPLIVDSWYSWLKLDGDWIGGDSESRKQWHGRILRSNGGRTTLGSYQTASFFQSRNSGVWPLQTISFHAIDTWNLQAFSFGGPGCVLSKIDGFLRILILQSQTKRLYRIIGFSESRDV